MPNIPDFTLSDGLTNFDCLIDGDTFTQNVFSEDRALAIDMSSADKKIGEFDEQRTWKRGRGSESFSKDPEGYYDGNMAWSVNKDILMSGLQWRFAKGLRVGEDFSLPGSVQWSPLYNVTGAAQTVRHQSRSFVAGTITGAGYTAALMGFWVKRVGTPGTLTVEICNDSAGSPGTVRTTGTLGAASIAEDDISYFVEITPTANALTNGTTYHVKAYGASTDTKENHWEIAIDVSATGKSSTDNSAWTSRGYGIHYWIASAKIFRRLWLFQYDGVQYAVTQNNGGSASKLFMNGARGRATSGAASTLTNTNAAFGTGSKFVNAYVRILRGTGIGQVRKITSHTNTVLTVTPDWDVNPAASSQYVIFYTDVFTELTGHGLSEVVSRPCVFGDIVYFPQGTGTNMRRMQFNAAASPPAHEYADDGTNKVAFLDTGVTLAGDKIYGAIGISQVSSAPAVTWPTNLTFANQVIIGQNTSRMNGMFWDDNKNALVVYKEDQAWAIDANNKATKLNYGFQDNQSSLNGVAAVSLPGFTYYTWLHSLMQVYGQTSTDVGMSFRGTGIKADKQGYFASLITAQQWVFAALDAYGQTSSVNIYDGQGWHEILQAPAANKRIRDLQWQTCEETGFNRLWTEVDGYLVYQDFPAYTNQLYYANGVNYQHETILESSVIDKGTASRLPKYIKELVAITENLAQGIYIMVEYQTDNDIFTNRWTRAGRFDESPEDAVQIRAQNVFRFRYRLIMRTQAVNTPVVVRGISPSGFARVPFKLMWTMRIKMDQLRVTGSNSPDDFYKWLTEKAQSAAPLRMTSEKHSLLNGDGGRWVIISPPSIIPTSPAKGKRNWKGVDTITLLEA